MSRPSADFGRSERERFVAAVLAREVVADVARRLEPEGIPVMPIKGVLLQQLLYPDDAAVRVLSDVDVLVRPCDYSRALSLLQQAGYRFRFESISRTQTALTAPSGMDLDLHFLLFGRARFALDTDGVFERARLETQLFDVPVWVQDPPDLVAHLVGKLASDHLGAAPGDEAAARRLHEVEAVAEHFTLDAEALAQHLVAVGMGRAARYALGLMVRHSGSPFASRVLEHLPRDPLGAVLAASARRVSDGFGARSLPAAIASHWVNRSLPAAALSTADATLQRIRWSLIGGQRVGGRGAARRERGGPRRT